MDKQQLGQRLASHLTNLTSMVTDWQNDHTHITDYRVWDLARHLAAAADSARLLATDQHGAEWHAAHLAAREGLDQAS